MDYEKELTDQKVILNDGKTEQTIVKVIVRDNVSELMIFLSDSKKPYLLEAALSNASFSFVNKNIQDEVTKEIADFKLKQKEEDEREKVEAIKRQATAIRNGKNTIEVVRIDRKNVAYKATYCDGNGDWFRAPCSAKCRNANCSRGGGRFCSTNSVCKRVVDCLANEEDVKDAFDNVNLCYESRMLLDFKIYAGRDDDGTVRGWSLGNDRLVILTTVKPGYSEEDRVIFGAFLVKQSFDKYNEEASATSYPDCRIALTEEESEHMKYWDYAPGEGKNNLIQWKEGLLRYQTDEMCLTVLKDLVKIIEKRNSEEQTNLAKGFLKKFLSIVGKEESSISEKNGARLTKNN